jgi:hypothetical protein
VIDSISISISDFQLALDLVGKKFHR